MIFLKGGAASKTGKNVGRGIDKRRTYFLSPSDRAGFGAARGVLSRWYSSLPVDSASCAASRVFLAAISASMPASGALN